MQYPAVDSFLTPKHTEVYITLRETVCELFLRNGKDTYKASFPVSGSGFWERFDNCYVGSEDFIKHFENLIDAR
jgi:hypothetical protein